MILKTNFEGRGREEEKHTSRPFITATCLFATNFRAFGLLVFLNRVTRSRIRGPAVTL